MGVAFLKKEAMWPRKDFLTVEESDIVAQAEAAKTKWLELAAQRSLIQNRAIQRAKFAVGARGSAHAAIARATGA